MSYSVIFIVDNLELQGILKQYIGQWKEDYSLVLHTTNAVLAASMIESLPAQIVLIQEGLNFYNENWFIRDTQRYKPNIRYILLKSQDRGSTLSEENQKRVSAILDWETLSPEELKAALDQAARDYDDQEKQKETLADENRWQKAYMRWLHESNLLAGVLGGTVEGTQIFRLDSSFKPGSFLLLIGENQTEPKWTFYNQNPVSLGKMYQGLEEIMERLAGLVLIASEKKLCFLFNVNRENQKEKLELFQKEIREWERTFMVPHLRFSASGIENDLGNLSALYREVDGTLKYHFFSGSDRIVTSSWLAETSVSLDLDELYHQMERLDTSFEQRDYPMLAGALGRISHMTWETLSFNSYEYVWGQLSYFYFSQARKYRLYPEEGFFNMNNREYPGFETAFQSMTEYLASLFQKLPGEKMETSNSHVNQAIALLRQNMEQNIGLAEAARRIHVSPSYLSHLFQKELGTTYINYSNHLRMEYAARLLQKPGKISQVAEKAGFEDSKYFSRLFKNIMGVSPREYQARMKAKEEDAG